MKNHLSILGVSIAVCTFLVAQASIGHRAAPGKSPTAFVQEKQDTGKHKMHKKNWKKAKDSTYQREKEKRDTSIPRF